jgi:hypothetical protein
VLGWTQGLLPIAWAGPAAAPRGVTGRPPQCAYAGVQHTLDTPACPPSNSRHPPRGPTPSGTPVHTTTRTAAPPQQLASRARPASQCARPVLVVGTEAEQPRLECCPACPTQPSRGAPSTASLSTRQNPAPKLGGGAARDHFAESSHVSHPPSPTPAPVSAQRRLPADSSGAEPQWSTAARHCAPGTEG